MATDIAKAYVQIIPSAEGISGNISNILDKDASKAGLSSGKTFSSSFGGAVGTGLKAVAGVATTAAAGIAALGSSLVSNAKDAAAMGDNIDKLSQKIGISAEAFQEWDYVFSQNGADISILETGMKKLSTTFADAASGSDSAAEKFAAVGLSIEDLQGLSQEDIFGKVISALQEMPEGAERTAAASDLLGKSAMELGPLLNSTAADTEALKQQAHNLGLVMSNDAVKDSAAFTDAMDNLSRAMDGVKARIASSLLPALTDITNGFANLVAGNEGAAEQIKSGFESIGTSIADAIPGITSTISTLASSLTEIVPQIVESLGGALMDALPQIASSLSDLVPQILNTILPMIPQLVEVGLQIIAELIKGIAQALPDLIPTIVEIIMQIIDTLVQNIPMLVEAAVQLIIGLAEGIIKAIPVLVSYIPQIITSIVEALVQAIPILVQGAIQLVLGIVENLPMIITSLIEALPQIIQAIADALPQLVPALIVGAVQLVIALVEHLPEIILALIEAIPQIIMAIIEAFGALAGALFELFSQAFEALAPAFNKLGEYAKLAWSKIQSAFSKVGAWFRTTFSQAIEGIKGVWSNIGAFFQSVWEKIVNVFKNAGSRFATIGKNIVAGIKSGISNAWNNLVKWFEGLFGDLIGIAKKILGIESPSKVFAQQVGQWIPAGIAMGIQEGMGVLDDQIKAMTDEALVGTITTSTEAVNNVNYIPSAPAMMVQDDRALELLAEYLPIIADNMNTTIEVNQNDMGTFEAVRRQNNRLVTATGYHALA